MLSIRGAICATFMSLLLTTTQTDCPACPHTTTAAAGRRGLSAGGIRDIVAGAAALDPGWRLQRSSYGRSPKFDPARDCRHARCTGSACAAPRAMSGLKVSSLRPNKHPADGKVPRTAVRATGMAVGRSTRAAHGLSHRCAPITRLAGASGPSGAFRLRSTCGTGHPCA